MSASGHFVPLASLLGIYHSNVGFLPVISTDGRNAYLMKEKRRVINGEEIQAVRIY
jgi:hypothetical protein